MNKLILAAMGAAAVILASCSSNGTGQQPASSAVQPPHLEKRGNVTQLIVEGKPYLALACELMNSSSSDPAYTEPYWPKLKAAGLNTVLAVVSWEQVEPVEGQFDFSALDAMLEAARKNDLKLAVLWFGSWKNGMSSYHPVWVKKDNDRFPPALTSNGDKLPILSTLGVNTMNADAKAYGEMMKHLKEVDSAYQTVVMIQMENEVGLHGEPRDHCPAANEAYAGQVSEKLMQYLSEHKDNLLPETLDAWKNSNYATSGTWEQVFGKGERTEEIFMAWNYASYMNTVSAAGKAVYPLPTFVNAWIVQPEDHHPGNYPSGGPQAQNHDIWRAAAPNIDILSPDIYLDDYPYHSNLYSRNGNPVFVPESRAGQNGAANAAWTIGERGGIGYSPFGFELVVDRPENASFSAFYKKAGAAADEILAAQAEGRIHAAWLKGSSPERLKSEVTMGDYTVCFELVSSGRRNGGAPQIIGGTYDPNAIGYAIVIQESEDEYLFLGSNIRVYFKPAEGKETVGLAKVRAGEFVDGQWTPGRWLNGDQIQLRYDVLPAVEEGFSGQGLNFGTENPEFIKVQLYKY